MNTGIEEHASEGMTRDNINLIGVLVWCGT
jgi:hypothetical protein